MHKLRRNECYIHTSDSDRDSGSDSNKDSSGTGPSGTTTALDVDRSADALGRRIGVELGANQSGPEQARGSDRTVARAAAPEGPHDRRLGDSRGVVADDRVCG